VIYRSRAHMVLNCDSVASNAVKGHVRRLKLWLQDPERENSFLSRAAVNAMYVFRKVRGK
jgi:hypothetical protein